MTHRDHRNEGNEAQKSLVFSFFREREQFNVWMSCDNGLTQFPISAQKRGHYTWRETWRHGPYGVSVMSKTSENFDSLSYEIQAPGIIPGGATYVTRRSYFSYVNAGKVKTESCVECFHTKAGERVKEPELTGSISSKAEVYFGNC